MTYVDDARGLLEKKLSGLDDSLLDLYTLLVLTSGKETSSQDVHDAWSVWRSRTQPDHRSLIPFAELTAGVQKLDDGYRDAIRDTADELNLG